MKARDNGERTLSDQQWDRIKRASGLPADARSYVESHIRSYGAWEDRPSVLPAKIKEKLRNLRSQAGKLLKGFEEALGPDDVYFALVPIRPNEWHPRNFEQRKELAEHHRTEKVRADLKALIDWLDQSERALSHRKRGPSVEHAQSVFLFIDSIDNALRYYTNKGLTRSDHHRKMMEEIFAIVDREVGKGTIDTAMRQVIVYGRRTDGKLLLPGSRQLGAWLSRETSKRPTTPSSGIGKHPRVAIIVSRDRR
jgi:hypothetical protein